MSANPISRLTLSQAIESSPRLLKAMQTLPGMLVTVDEAMKQHEDFRLQMEMDPISAVVVGNAEGNQVHHVGVYGHSGSNYGVYAESRLATGLYATGKEFAARFVGNIDLIGDLRCTGADCAENFDVVENEVVEPGTVMILGDDGLLKPSHCAYDTRIAGVISGAGDYKPGLVLDKRESKGRREPIALVGKVFCKVDASRAPIEVGALLTTSDTPGHAMAATDKVRALGCIVGKAIQPLASGIGLIPILVALQ